MMDPVQAARSLVDIGFSPTQATEIMTGAHRIAQMARSSGVRMKAHFIETPQPIRQPVAKAIVNESNITERLAALDREVAEARVKMKTAEIASEMANSPAVQKRYEGGGRRRYVEPDDWMTEFLGGNK